MRQSLFIKTDDGVEIAADYYPVEKSIHGAVLIHMMPETRRSFYVFAAKLQARGISALAIDLRGHGDSIRGPEGAKLDYKTFSDKGHQESIHDVRAGVSLLRSKGIQELCLIGASIGANLALQELADTNDIRKAVLLSPGYNYRGIETKPFMARLHAGQAVLLAASSDDMRGSGHSAEEMAYGLASQAPLGVRTEVKFFSGAAHGTELFEREPSFMDEIIVWIEKAR